MGTLDTASSLNVLTAALCPRTHWMVLLAELMEVADVSVVTKVTWRLRRDFSLCSHLSLPIVSTYQLQLGCTLSIWWEGSLLERVWRSNRVRRELLTYMVSKASRVVTLIDEEYLESVVLQHVASLVDLNHVVVLP